MLVIVHRLRFTVAILISGIPFVGCVIRVVVVRELSFFPGAFIAYPACVDVAVTKLVQELALNFFGFGFGVTVGTKTQCVFILKRTIEMWTALWIACAWRLARIVPALLYENGISSKAPQGV